MPKPRSLTIKQIADEAGVSVTTASFVINDKWAEYGIAAKTVERVRKVVKKYNFRPNFGVMLMRTGKSMTIAFLAPTIADGFYNRIIIAIEKAALDQGSKLILCNTMDDLKIEATYIEDLIHRQIEGVVIVPVDPAAGHLRLLLNARVPTVLFAHPELVPSGFSAVDFDMNMGMEQLLRHLIGKGCRKIAILDWIPLHESGSSWHRLRSGLRNTVCKILQSRKLPLADFAFWPLFGESEDLSDGETLARNLRKARPDAIIAMRSIQLLRAWRTISESGLKVPDDLRLAACDDIPSNPYWFPSLTGVQMPKEELAAHAFEQLIGAFPKVPSKLFPVQLVPRDSSC